MFCDAFSHSNTGEASSLFGARVVVSILVCMSSAVCLVAGHVYGHPVPADSAVGKYTLRQQRGRACLAGMGS